MEGDAWAKGPLLRGQRPPNTTHTLSQAQSPLNECLGVYFSPGNTDDEFQGRPMGAVRGLEKELRSASPDKHSVGVWREQATAGSEEEAQGTSEPVEQSDGIP